MRNEQRNPKKESQHAIGMTHLGRSYWAGSLLRDTIVLSCSSKKHRYHPRNPIVYAEAFLFVLPLGLAL